MIFRVFLRAFQFMGLFLIFFSVLIAIPVFNSEADFIVNGMKVFDPIIKTKWLGIPITLSVIALFLVTIPQFYFYKLKQKQ